MKKVYHVISNSWTSGLETVAMNICSLVPGIDFTCIVPNGEIVLDLEKNNIKYITVSRVTPISIRKIIKENDIDIIHAHDVKASLCISYNYFLCKKKNIVTISELHNDDERMHKLTLRSVIYNLTSFSYNKIVMVSQKILDNYVFKYFVKDKTIVIDNVVNPAIIKESSEDSNKSIESDFIFLGRLEYQKNPMLFLDFIRLIKKNNISVKAFMIGKGSMKNKINEKISEYGLDENVKLLGYKSNPYPYIKATKSVVITSRYEGLCLVAIESLILGKSVITTDASGVNQIVTGSCGIKSNDLSEMVDYGNKILNDDNFRRKAEYNALKRSNIVNNVNLFVEKYKKLYV